MNRMSFLSYRRLSVTCEAEIPESLQDTPIGSLLRYHNLEAPLKEPARAKLVIVMCMDHRKQLRIPNRFAFMLRTAGARITDNEFKLSYPIAITGIRHVALIGHTQCGMQGLETRREQFISGLVETAGWDRERASLHFDVNVARYAIPDAQDFVRDEARRLSIDYPGVTFVPMIYQVEDFRLYLIPTS